MPEYNTGNFVAVDIETTGLSPTSERIIEIGALRVRDGKVEEEFDMLLNPERSVGSFITGLTGITDEMLERAPDTESALRAFLDFAGEDALLGHNIDFDYGFLKKNMADIGESFERRGIDTLRIARKHLPQLEDRSLATLCSYYGIINQRAHRACEDARATFELYCRLREEFCEGTQDGLFLPAALNVRIKKESPATPAQLKYLRALMAQHGIELQVEAETLTKREASRQIDRIISTCGRLPGRY